MSTPCADLVELVQKDGAWPGGEWMRTWAKLSANGRLDGETHIWTNNEFRGFTGGATVFFVDEEGNILENSPLKTAGVDGRWIPGKPSSRTIWWDYQHPNVIQDVDRLVVLNKKEPRSRLVEIVDEMLLREADHRGHQVVQVSPRQVWCARRAPHLFWGGCLMSSWVDQASSRVDFLQSRLNELTLLRDSGDERRKGQFATSIGERLEETRKDLAAVGRSNRRFAGGAANSVWNELHHIEEQIYEHLDTPGSAEDCARLHSADQRFAEELARAGSAEKRRSALLLIRAAHKASQRPRTSRSGTTAAPAPWVVLFLVMITGAAGAALSGMLTLYVSNEKIPDTLWFDPRPALLVVKIVMDMWTAFIGVLLVGTETVVGLYTSLASLLLLALTFGYAQQAVTTFVDRKATQTLPAPG